jgi:ABC-type glycerol-3-phosphate transport system substrate-binding protein
MLYNSIEFASDLKWTLATPYLPANKQVTLSPGYFEYMNKYPGIKTFLAQLKNSRVSFQDERKDQVMCILGENIKSAIKGQISPDDAINNSSEKANQILDPTGTLRTKKAELEITNRYIDRVWDKI